MNKKANNPGWLNFSVYMWALIILWTGCVAASLAWNANQQRKVILSLARMKAELTLEKDILYRRWISSKGGAYFTLSEATPANPYLKVPHRDVTTNQDQNLTLVNPAYMSRQVSEMAKKEGIDSGHITSLKPTRPETSPDPWEAKALKAFEKGEKEFGSIESISGKPYFRHMHPFYVEESCLKCHAYQGYKVGDIRGGISTSISMEPLYAVERDIKIKLLLAHSLLWMLGIIGIVFAVNRVSSQVKQIKQSEEDLKESESLLKEAQHLAQIGHWELDPATGSPAWSEEVFHIFGLDPAQGEPSFEDHQKIIHPDDWVILNNAITQSSIKGTAFDIEFRIVRPDKSIRWINAKGYTTRDSEGKIIRLFGTAQDITERKHMEQQLQTMSLTDELTGLYNRRGFFTLAQQQMKVAERTKKDMLLFFVDLDKMKQINDTLGHQEGDEALIEVATILKEVFRESDIIGRMGGDEFAILAIDTTDETRDVLMKRLNNTLDAYNRPEGRKYQLSLSMGIAHYNPETPSTLDELMAQADRLMYEEKRGR